MRSSGPGHHLLILRASRDFWDDRPPELVEPAEQETEAEFSVLATAVSELGRTGDRRSLAVPGA
ncbi:hypothetical protein ACWD04_18710 [Streptomyces sp. NPDC002911]